MTATAFNGMARDPPRRDRTLEPSRGPRRPPGLTEARTDKRYIINRSLLIDHLGPPIPQYNPNNKDYEKKSSDAPADLRSTIVVAASSSEEN
jgi:hypothetical protein